jgi:transcription-repair coupling factor (superfamily II helicase)
MPFKVGQRINLNEVIRQWVALGYQPEEVVEVPGSFSRRGGILDIFPPSATMPVRVELFGDEIDSLRNFDPMTQRSEGRLQAFTVGPAIEPLPRYAARAATQLSQWDLTQLQPSAKRAFEEDVARLTSGATFRGVEYYLSFFYNGAMIRGEEEAMTRGSSEAMRRNDDETEADFTSSSSRLMAASPYRLVASSVLEYLPDDALLFIEDAEELALVIDELETQARTLKHNLTDVGDLPPDWPDPYFGWTMLAPALAARNPMVLGFTPLKTTADRRPPTADRSSHDSDNTQHPAPNSQFRAKGPLRAIHN